MKMSVLSATAIGLVSLALASGPQGVPPTTPPPTNPPASTPPGPRPGTTPPGQTGQGQTPGTGIGSGAAPGSNPQGTNISGSGTPGAAGLGFFGPLGSIPGGVVPPDRPLSLADLLGQVDRTYPKLNAVRQEIAVAGGKAREKRGAFDPVFSIGSDILRYNPSSSPGKAYETTLNEGVLEFLDPSGVKYFAGARLNWGDVKSPATSTGDTGEYFAGVKIPLLRDLGINEKSVAERQARLGIDVARQGVAVFRLAVLRDAAGTYWEWAGAAERFRISEELLRVGRTREAQIRERVRAGDLPRIDLVEAEQEVRRREAGLVKAERDLQKAAFKLSLYVWPDRTDAGGAIPYSAAPPLLNGPLPPEPPDVTAEQNRAVALRPEILSFVPVERTLRLDLDLARNERKPALDVVIGPGLDTGSGSIGPTWKAGVFFSVPLRQNFADGLAEQARAKLAKLDLDRALAIQQIRIEVADAVNAVRLARERLIFSRQEVELARQLEEAERIRFAEGDSTLFLVNQRERATAEAAFRLVDVFSDLQLSTAGLAAVTAGF